ncbi:MAG: hypothetical protein PHN38_03045 [Sulfurospirillaceae bacterium]|nr:hypothetical protein [Sulfurospirillaceae bacterium]MDD3462335.1 hypothetical protein [Sulfurospirillaceae bacterium]
MHYIFSFGLVLLFIWGCSQKDPNTQLQMEKATEYALANTKKTDISNLDGLKTYISATYLTPIKHPLIEDNEKENFLVAIYIQDGYFKGKNITQDEVLQSFRFGVNGRYYDVKTDILAKENPLLRIVPTSNPWAKYIHVKAPLLSDINVSLSLESDLYKTVELKFQKDY